MELNKIQSSGSWGKVADDLNQNFSKVNNAVEQVKNATTRNKGYFSTDTALKSAFKSASLGDIAYVQNSNLLPFERWEWDGAQWIATGVAGGDQKVELGDYYTKDVTDAKLSELGSKASKGITNTPIELINEYQAASTSTMIRANNFRGYFKGVVVYLSTIGTVEYGTMNIETGDIILLGEKDIYKIGENRIEFDNYIDCSSNVRIFVRSKKAGTARIGGISKNGVGMFEFVDGEMNYFESWELAYNCISSFDAELNCKIRQLQLQETITVNDEYIKTNNTLEGINKYKSATRTAYRGNYLTGKIYGLHLYAIDDGVIEVGVFNRETFTATPIKEKHLYKGLNTLLFESPVICDSDNQIYVYSKEYHIIAGTDNNGIGMFEYTNGTYTLFDNWELAYYGIKNIGIKSSDLLISKSDLRYGELIVPSAIHILQGQEYTLYWSNIANIREGDSSIYFETDCPIGRNTERGFVIGDKYLSSDKEDINEGTYYLDITVRRSADRSIVSQKTIKVIVVNKFSGKDEKNILMIGDSRTWQSISSDTGTNGRPSIYHYVYSGNKTISSEVYNLAQSNDGVKLNMIGDFVSDENPNVRNMAESGATYEWAINKIYEAGGIVSYCEKNGLTNGQNLNYATIMFGVNDINDWGNENIGQYDRSIAKINSVCENAKLLIDTIHQGYPQCNIILVIEPTTCASQDGFGYYVGSEDKRKSAHEVELAMKTYRKRILDFFGDYGIGDFLTICAGGLFLDRLWGFPYIITKENARVQRDCERFINNVHPFDDGYKQIADGIFATIKWLGYL